MLSKQGISLDLVMLAKQGISLVLNAVKTKD